MDEQTIELGKLPLAGIEAVKLARDRETGLYRLESRSVADGDVWIPPQDWPA